MKRVLIVLFALIFASVSFAASPFFFKGYAHVNGSLAPNGTIITIYVNNNPTPANSIIIGQGQLHGVIPTGLYTISAEANTGDNITFRVNNISLIASNGTNISAQRLGSIVVENFNLSVNKTADGSACAYDIGCTGGFCVHSLCRAASTYCGDGFCDSGESSSSCSADCGTTTTTGGGGGGAATTTTAPSNATTTVATTISTTTTTTIPVIVKVNLTADVPKAIEVNTTHVDKITITATVNAPSVSVTVTETSKPAEAPAPVTATSSVYKYVEIKASNIAATSISKAKISFKVSKSWISSEGIDKNTITLNRLVGSQWTKLATTLASESAADITYEAESPGFSTFAITGNKVATTTTPTTVPATTVPPTTTTAPAQPVVLSPYLIIAVVIILLAAVAYFRLLGKKGRRQYVFMPEKKEGHVSKK